MGSVEICCIFVLHGIILYVWNFLLLLNVSILKLLIFEQLTVVGVNHFLTVNVNIFACISIMLVYIAEIFMNVAKQKLEKCVLKSGT